VLNLLCDGALANQQFRIAPIEYPTDVYPEEAPVDDDEEVSADIADTVAPTADEDEDDGYQLSRKEVKKEESKDTKIIESTIDPNAWKVHVFMEGAVMARGLPPSLQDTISTVFHSPLQGL
jgi:hypothetical protein